MVWHNGAKPLSSPCSKISYRQILFYLTFTVLKNNYIWLHPWQTRQHLKKIWTIYMLVLVFDNFKRLGTWKGDKSKFWFFIIEKFNLLLFYLHIISLYGSWKHQRISKKWPQLFHYLWFLPSMMEPIKMRHHLNITIPNGSWSICSTIRCIFLAVVLQALLVMRSDEVEGGLPISSTSRSGALARLSNTVGNSTHFLSH